MLSTKQQKAICSAANCLRIVDITPMQQLWADQGELIRLTLSGVEAPEKESYQSLVAKKISFQVKGEHPHGWNTLLSQQRKRHSYEVELHWYREFLSLVEPSTRIPKLIYSEASELGILLVLDDLAVDYPVHFTAGKEDRPTEIQIASCVRWLAQFHARFLNYTPKQLWPIGGYWHLETRPDEWHAMPESQLKRLAKALDQQLQSCPYQTLMHGDAKLANFCFSGSGEHVAAVDFQYVGQGPGVKDLMLLLSSVMPDHRLASEAEHWLNDYFKQLAIGLRRWQPSIEPSEVEALWRPLYAVAWADFHRFLAGWSPDHWKIGNYCQQQTQLALTHLSQLTEEQGKSC